MSDDMEDDLVLSELDDDELVEQMHDDLYDGMAAEVVEGVNILLERGWTPVWSPMAGTERKTCRCCALK